MIAIFFIADPGHLDPEIRIGMERSPKNVFRPFGPQFGLNIKGVPRSATDYDVCFTGKILIKTVPNYVIETFVLWPS